MRLFFPHKYIQQEANINCSQDNGKLFDGFQQDLAFDIHKIFSLEFIEKSITKSINVRAGLISQKILEISCPKDFIKTVSAFGIKINRRNASQVAIRMLAPIINELDLDNDDLIELTIKKVNHLFSLASGTKEKFQRTVHKSIKNIILNNRGSIIVPVYSYEDLNKIISIYNRFQITINPKLIIEEIENTPSIRKIKEQVNLDNEEIWENEKLSRIYNIFFPYLENVILPQTSIFYTLTKNGKKTKRSKLKQLIDARDNIERSIDEFGRHDRDSRLVLLLKEYYNYECQSCDSKPSHVTEITVSHKIPRYFGVEFGGVDKSINLEVLCRFCHDQYEKKFHQEIFENPELKMKQDLINYLKEKFPDNTYIGKSV